MRLYGSWIIIGLLTIIILSHIFIACNILEVFLFNQNKIKLATIPTTTQKYADSTRSRIYDATGSNLTTWRHRHRYKFNKKLGRYVRIKKPELEQANKQKPDFTNAIINPVSDFYVTNQTTITAANNINSSVMSDTLNITFSDKIAEASFIWNIFAFRTFFTSDTIATTTTTMTPIPPPISTAIIIANTSIATASTSVPPVSTNIISDIVSTTARTTTITPIPLISTNIISAITFTTTTTSTTTTTAVSETTTFSNTSGNTTSSNTIPSLFDRLNQQKQQHQSSLITRKPLTLLSSSTLSQPLLKIPSSSLSSLVMSESSVVPLSSSPISLLASSESSSLSVLDSSESSLILSPLLSSFPSTLPLLRSLSAKLQLLNMEKNLDLSKKSDNFLNTSTEVKPILQTKKLEPSPSSSSIKFIDHSQFKVSQITSKLHQQQASKKEKLDFSKSVETFQQTTNASSRFTTSGFTLVTALLDIGRGDWWEYRRPLESYYGFLENVLKLKVNLIIFVDQKSIEHVYSRRKLHQLEHITKAKNFKIIPIILAELPLYQYMNSARKIIADEQSGKCWDQQWDQSMSSHPEAKSAEYDILVNSKSYFLYNASRINPFKSEFFAWLDAGYAHGNQSIFPPSFHWHPTLIPRKINLIKVTPSYDNIFRYKLTDLYRKNWAVISGGFLGGDIYSLNRFHQLYHRMVVDMIHQKYVDDDQTTLVLLIQQHPSLFNVVHGDWFDAFYLFS